MNLLADILVAVHFLFVVFVIMGGLLALWKPRVVWLHIPAAVWGAFIEFSGLLCPLTPLENFLRVKSGQTGYTGGFIERYILPVLYPDGLTREIQVGMGIFVIGINILIYGLIIVKLRRKQRI